MGHEERFPPTKLSAGCGFRKETITGIHRYGRDAFDVPVRGEASLFVSASSSVGRPVGLPKSSAARNAVAKPSEAQDK
jgi:hypothetical protein